MKAMQRFKKREKERSALPGIIKRSNLLLCLFLSKYPAWSKTPTSRLPQVLVEKSTSAIQKGNYFFHSDRIFQLITCS